MCVLGMKFRLLAKVGAQKYRKAAETRKEGTSAQEDKNASLTSWEEKRKKKSREQEKW